jgi:hypothetical protein
VVTKFPSGRYARCSRPCQLCCSGVRLRTPTVAWHCRALRPGSHATR